MTIKMTNDGSDPITYSYHMRNSHMDRSLCILSCVEGGHKKIWVSMNLIYRKSHRNVCYFYPNTKDEKSPIRTFMSIFFPILYPICREVMQASEFTWRVARHVIKYWLKITLVRRVASIIADLKYQFGREQFLISRASLASWKCAEYAHSCNRPVDKFRRKIFF